ncbi:hypothetical protein VM1G_00666 [Cytospora mali]|uniref:Uncharacterized protein n=1 Tax=Cytospora mali TaxID=578113 RepID=A0A194VMF0_CYTMA|nr:hypothetical protein VM1G_00666 [Valsa mali]
MKHVHRVKKSWLQRKGGIMKKADEIRDKFNARVAVLIERNGVLYAYLSHDDFLKTLPGKLDASNRVTPDHYITVAQQKPDGAVGALSPLAQADKFDVMSTSPESQTRTSLVQSPPKGVAKRSSKPVIQRTYFDGVSI